MTRCIEKYSKSSGSECKKIKALQLYKLVQPFTTNVFSSPKSDLSNKMLVFFACFLAANTSELGLDNPSNISARIGKYFSM